MKRIILICICALFLLVGTAFADTWTVGFVTGVEKGIQSGFIKMASQGLYKAKQEYGFNVITGTPENVSQESMEAAFLKLIEKKPGLVLATGFQMSEHVRKFAPLHPGILFLMIDVPIENMKNVMSVQFAANEGSFLAGALAGWMTKTGAVGAVGGVNVPPVVSFLTGFSEGVSYANPSVKVKKAFITKMPDFSGFSDPARGAALAKKWFGNEVDIIFAVAGTTGNGIIHQAKKDGKYAIGVDVNQDGMAKGHVLTSMLKRVDVAVYLAISQIINRGFEPGIRRYGLKEQGVGLTKMEFTKNLLSETVLNKLKEAEAKIISGELKVSE